MSSSVNKVNVLPCQYSAIRMIYKLLYGPIYGSILIFETDRLACRMRRLYLGS